MQEATAPTWSGLLKAAPDEAQGLLAADLPFLRWRLETFSLKAVLCNGRSVFDHVCRLVGGNVVTSGKLRRLTWYVGRASLNGRPLALAGWNIPLARPTGLGIRGEAELGEILSGELVRLGVT